MATESTRDLSQARTRLLTGDGGEEIYSLFAQDKHKFNSQWILNVGGRFDSKTRKGGETFQKVSPRAALIYLPDETFEDKLSYSQSFVDAPYWYRYNRGLAAFGGSEALARAVDYGKFDGKFSHVSQFSTNLIFNYLFNKELIANASV